jgi:hypothetical protein
MGIQKIGSTNVYVINADVPRARDGRGKSYSTLYTDLRWQIWGEVQKSALQEMKFDNELYQMQLETINDQIKQQRKLIADLQSGELDAQDAAAIDKSRYEKSLKVAQAGQTSTVSRSQSSSTGTYSADPSAVGGKKADPQLAETSRGIILDASATAGAEASDAFSMVDPLVSATNLAISGKGTVAGKAVLSVSDPADQNAMRHYAVDHAIELERAQAIRDGEDPDVAAEAILSSFPADFQSAYKSGAAAVATGAGSTRSSQRSASSVKAPLFPLTDTTAPEIPVASRAEELKRLQAELLGLQTERSGIARPSTDPLQRTREEFAQRIGPGGFGTDARPERRQELFDEQRSLEDAVRIMDNKQVLLDKEFQLQARKRKLMEEADVLGGGEILGAAIQDINNQISQIQSFTSKLSAPPVAQGDFLGRAKAPEPSLISSGRRPELASSFPEEDIADPADGFNPLEPVSDIKSPSFRDVELDFLGAQELRQEPKAGFRSQTMADKEEALRSQVRADTGLPDARSRVERKLPKSAGEILPIGAEKIAQPQSPGQKERRANYQARAVMEGIKLASQQKKFERLARPNLSDAERKTAVPEYVRMVEEIYETNISAGADPVRATFSEVSKVYANDPSTMKAAHAYIFALDTLKNRKPE